jgi:hypothetical protein
MLSPTEIQSLRFHLNYGSINFGAYPYTPDGFIELFNTVIAPNVQSGDDTSSTTAITAASTAVVTVVSMTNIIVRERLVVDVGDDAEIVVVKATSGSTFTAAFAKVHSAAGYPISTLSGESRLRLLLHDADRCWQKLQDPSITKTAGLKQLGRGQIEWQSNGFRVLADTRAHYRSIQESISTLVRVPLREQDDDRSVSLAGYG